ncbi:MAG TPA: GNAT family N-acetyltransferase [Rhizomicrobium sp.]|nr:GNAT family N-acetyltransferase [Rhizomicrobium sp.]
MNANPAILIEATDEHFAWMLGEADGPNGLSLPPHGVDDPATLAMLRTVAASQRARRQRGIWLIVADGQVVGLCGFKELRKRGSVEIGFGIARTCRGRGHATQAVARLLIEAAADPETGALTAQTAISNSASLHALQNNGFLKVGTRDDSEDGELIMWCRSAR